MYVMNRKLWITAYVAVWVFLGAVFFTDSPLWESILASVLALAFVSLTDPAPRKPATVRAELRCARCVSMRRIATVRAELHCARCVSMRARYARRNADTKDAG